MDRLVSRNAAAWEHAARAYRDRLDEDIAELRASRLSLLAAEREMLGDLSDCTRAVHLQCSHGQDALSLWLLGAREVVGVDISGEMLALAEEKARAIGARARWVRGDVASLNVTEIGRADVVYTGKGALPYVSDIDAWAWACTSLVRPGGRLCLFEQHPLTWVWDPDARHHRLRKDGGDYFFAGTRPSREYGEWEQVDGNGSTDSAAPQALPPCERQWTIGQVVTALAGAGLRIVSLTEYPDHYWPQFPNITEHEARRLPRTWSVVGERLTTEP